jgi:hypothetical protein
MRTDVEHLTLTEARERNLAALGGKTLHVHNGEKDSFVIESPTLVSAPFTEAEFKELEPFLREKRLSYTTRHIPPYYYKDQGNKWLIELELDCYYDRGTTSITLMEFGASYGKIIINGIAVAISHSGGTGKEPGTWVDFTTGFHLAGLPRIAAMRSMIESMQR